MAATYATPSPPRISSSAAVGKMIVVKSSSMDQRLEINMTRQLIGLATIAALAFGVATTAIAQQAPNADCKAGTQGWAQCLFNKAGQGNGG